MGKIIYGVCGEGLGHAARVMTIVNELRLKHEFVIFAASSAYTYLKKHLAPSGSIRLERIPGLNFRYLFKRISYVLSVTSAIPYVLSMDKKVAEMQNKVAGLQADLVITDFEPLTARLARKQKIPLISIDHQHFITQLDLQELPWSWRLRARIMSWFIRLYFDWQDQTVVSSFFSQAFQSTDAVQHVGVTLRSRMQIQKPANGPAIVVYLRRFHSRKLLQLLGRRKEKFLIYGHHVPRTEGNLEFKQVDNETFCEDLAQCRALICNAGNQLVGEALSFGKPVLALPESGNFEQQLNGHFLNQMVGGTSVPFEKMNDRVLTEFVESLDEYRRHIDRQSVVGNQQIIRFIDTLVGPESANEKLKPESLSIPA